MMELEIVKEFIDLIKSKKVKKKITPKPKKKRILILLERLIDSIKSTKLKILNPNDQKIKDHIFNAFKRDIMEMSSTKIEKYQFWYDQYILGFNLKNRYDLALKQNFKPFDTLLSEVDIPKKEIESFKENLFPKYYIASFYSYLDDWNLIKSTDEYLLIKDIQEEIKVPIKELKEMSDSSLARKSITKKNKFLEELDQIIEQSKDIETILTNYTKNEKGLISTIPSEDLETLYDELQEKLLSLDKLQNEKVEEYELFKKELKKLKRELKKKEK